MNIRITLPAVVVFATVAGACEQNPVRALRPASPAAAVIATDGAAPIPGGTANDYQPSLIRAADGRLMIVLERLAARTNSGDLYVSTSTNGGASWSVPSLVVGRILRCSSGYLAPFRDERVNPLLGKRQAPSRRR